MRRTGRAPLFLALIIFAASHTSSTDYVAPVEIQLWDTGRTPLAHMVDVTNEFGLKILAEHNFLNDNNIAFSPYGLTGIMIALFEGVSGEASYQIQTGMQLPWSRNVMRIGFRDIHRTLKTYFVPEEGFLAGLALNNENVTFTENYKKVLRFYGFELEKDQIPTLPPTMPDNSTQPPTEAMTTSGMMTMETPAREEVTTTSAPEQTTNPNAETIGEVSPPTTAIPTENAAVEAATSPATTEAATSPAMSEAATSAATTDAATAPTTATPPPETSTTIPAASEAPTAPPEPTENNEVETISPTESEQTTASETSSTSPDAASTMGTQMEQMTTSEMDPTTIANDSTLETLDRKKKSIVDFIFTNPPYVDDYLVYRASYDVPSPEEPPNIHFFDDKMFLANGLRNVEVSYMHFDTILDHAFLPHLEASALRLPLDSERYYLLVVVPARGGGAAELGRLIARMARESDLRDVHAAMRPRRVRAVVPSFTVKGHITLTTDLQKLGIRDVFEPRQRDFTPMTPQPGVYVRSVEQAVSVAIRKYRPDQAPSNRYTASQPPVHFSATYPFVYFVMDSSIHVALMAGKMADPLNSRIL